MSASGPVFRLVPDAPAAGGDLTPNMLDDAREHIEEMSEPQEHAIAQEAERQAALGADVDAAGEPWNAAIHATGFDGKGVKTAKGLWRRRRNVTGARASIVGAPSTDARGTPISLDVAGQKLEQESRSAGVAAANTVLMLGQALGGDEWRPIQNAEENEQAMMEKAWGDYFVAKKVTDFPPGVALSMCCIGYCVRRFTMPVTQSRVQRFKEWVGGKIGRWKMRRQARRQGLEVRP